MSTIKVNNLQHPSAASPAIVLDADGGATVAGMGLVLVSPTSIANSGGSASASGGAVTFTGVTSVSLNGVFNSTYENYRLLINVTNTSTGDVLYARFRASGTDTSTATYTYGTGRAGRTTLSDGSGVTGSFLNLNFTTAGSFAVGVYDFYSPNTSGLARMTGNAFALDGGPVARFTGGICTQATAHDGITFVMNTGTMTGTIRVYGYQN